MDNILTSFFNEAQSEDKGTYEPSLSDLRFVIERFTMERYNMNEENDYLKLFYVKSLINYRLDLEKLILVKHFLFYLLLNFPDRAALTGKCIKVLFDRSIYEAIYTAIEVYMEKDDLATCELIYAITNSVDTQAYLKNERIFELFQRILKFGGKYSQNLVKDEFEFRKKFFPDESA